jgi:exosortase/archaeosortase family protein
MAPAASAVAPPSSLRRFAVLRTSLAVGLVVVCYQTSLWSLLRGITVDTPLAFLGLVPVIALVLGCVLARPEVGEPDIHDRMVDRIVAVPLVVAALVALVLLPTQMSTMYWLYRIDLLTMPLFVAGVVALLFGVRLLWRVRAAILFLFLAWPVPAQRVAIAALEPMGDLAASAVGVAVHIIPVAERAGGDGISFLVPHGPRGFHVQIASACSGANGLVGFLLVAGAIAITMRGTWVRKVAWLATGAAAVVLLNVVRIMSILAVGRVFGERAAIDILHPYVGLLTFNIGVFVMVLVSGRFGLLPFRREGPSRAQAIRSAVPTLGWVLPILVVVALIGGVFDHGLTRYDPIASSVGAPRLGTFAQVSTQPDGFYAEPVDTIDAGRRFFGEDSSWIRYSFVGDGPEGLSSDVPVLADVVSTSNLQSFSDFGLEACYRFHGFDMGSVRRVDLGHGVVGTVLNWQQPDNGLRWTTVYWVWAVRDGHSTSYERVVLLLNDVDGARIVAPEVTPEEAGGFGLRADELVRGASAGGSPSAEQARSRSFLVTFARNLVTSSVDRSERLAEQVGSNGIGDGG